MHTRICTHNWVENHAQPALRTEHRIAFPTEQTTIHKRAPFHYIMPINICSTDPSENVLKNTHTHTHTHTEREREREREREIPDKAIQFNIL